MIRCLVTLGLALMLALGCGVVPAHAGPRTGNDATADSLGVGAATTTALEVAPDAAGDTSVEAPAFVAAPDTARAQAGTDKRALSQGARDWLKQLAGIVVGGLILWFITARLLPDRRPPKIVIVALFAASQFIPGPIDDLVLARWLLGMTGGAAVGALYKLLRQRESHRGVAGDEKGSGEPKSPPGTN